MIKKQCFLVLLLLFYASHSFAISYSCPTTFQVVNTGDTSSQVQAACGEPATISTQQQSQSTQVPVTEWIYNYVAAPIIYKNTVTYLPVLSLSLVVLFQNDQVFQIEKNGVPVNNATLCSLSGLVNMNDTSAMVRLKCGQPNYVSSFMMPVNNNQTVVVWTYNSGAYRPQQMFNFIDDKLVSVKNSSNTSP